MASLNKDQAHILLEYLDTIYKKYKHVAIKLESYWGTELGHRYLKYLLLRDRDREGFDFETYVMLMALYVMHSNDFTSFNDPLLLDDLNLNADSIKQSEKELVD